MGCVPPAPRRERSLDVDYLDETPEPRPAVTSTPDAALVDAVDAPAAAPVTREVDPLLAELLSDDRNLRRRVVSALLRATLADRRIT